VELAIACRALWWSTLLIGVLLRLFNTQLDWTLLSVAGPALALVASGRFGLEPGTGAFEPRVLTRSLLVMMMTALTMAHFMAYVSVLGFWVQLPSGLDALNSDPGVVPILLLASAVGLGRTRAWGLFAYGAAILVSGGLAITLADMEWRVFHGFCAGVLVLFGAPVFLAVIFKRRPSLGGRRWGQYAVGTLVGAAIVLVAYLTYQNHSEVLRL
jgi:hypothetical protein